MRLFRSYKHQKITQKHFSKKKYVQKQEQSISEHKYSEAQSLSEA